MFFQQYTAIAIDNIYHRSIINEWKANTVNQYYEEKHYLGVSIPYENRELSQSKNVEHLPIWLLNEIE